MHNRNNHFQKGVKNIRFLSKTEYFETVRFGDMVLLAKPILRNHPCIATIVNLFHQKISVTMIVCT